MNGTTEFTCGKGTDYIAEKAWKCTLLHKLQGGKMKTEPGYEPLANVLQEALDQSQLGKGRERHANDKPFLEQPIMTEARDLPSGATALAFQARKKIREALNCPDDGRAIRDLLGAINYTAAMVLLRREGQEKYLRENVMGRVYSEAAFPSTEGE